MLAAFKIRIVQINFNHCRLAHHLLTQAAREFQADVILISEPLYNPGEWVYGKRNTTAIWTTGFNGLRKQEDGDTEDEDFVAVRLNNIAIVSIYLSPNTSEDVYAAKFERITEFLKGERRRGRSIIIGGDFNARSPAWGSDRQNQKGTIVLEELAKVEIYPVPPVGGHTFERRNERAILDIIATTPELQGQDAIYSRISDKESASDHKYIVTELFFQELGEPRSNAGGKWKATMTGLNKLKITLERSLRTTGLTEGEMFSSEEEGAFLELLPKVCDESLEKPPSRKRKIRSNLWWSPELRDSRNKVQKLRRAKQRAKKRGREDEWEALEFLHKQAKKELRRKIVKAKEEKWDELCETINRDVWGKPYKSIMKQVKSAAPPVNLSPEYARTVMRELFPQEEGGEGMNDFRIQDANNRQEETTADRRPS